MSHQSLPKQRAHNSTFLCAKQLDAIQRWSPEDPTQEHLSLDNFLEPRFENHPLVLSSPRSLRACEALKISPVDLIPPRIDNFVKNPDGEIEKDIQGFHNFANAQHAHRRLLRLARLQRSKYMRGRLKVDETFDKPKYSPKQKHMTSKTTFAPQPQALFSSEQKCEGFQQEQCICDAHSGLSRILYVQSPRQQTRRREGQRGVRQLDVQKRSLHTAYDDGFTMSLKSSPHRLCDDADIEAFLEAAGSHVSTRLERALMHPSNLRQNVTHTTINRAQWRRNRAARQEEASLSRDKRKQDHRQAVAASRREEISHLKSMRRHVEERAGIGSVRHHPAFISMKGNDQSCLF